MWPYIPIIFAYRSDNKTPSYYRKFFWKLKWEWGEKGQPTTHNLLCQTSIARHGREADAFAWFDQLCAFQPSSDHHASHFNLYLGFAVGQNGQVVLPSRPHFDHHQLYFGLNYVFLKKGGHRTPKWSICIHLSREHGSIDLKLWIWHPTAWDDSMNLRIYGMNPDQFVGMAWDPSMRWVHNNQQS